jgi:drug/metabolite transporter (DMT)-like permease
MGNHPPSQLKTIINLGIVYIVWGSTFLGVKYAIEVVPPLMVSTIRFLIGGGLLFLFCTLRGYPLPSWRQARSAAWIGMLLSGFGNSAVAYALRFMPSGLVALLVATLPVWMSVLDFYFFSKQKPSKLTALGLVIGLLGMCILLNPFDVTGNRDVSLWPAFLVFGGSVAWAWGSLQAPYLDTPPQLQATAIQMIAGGVVALTLSLLTEPQGIASLSQMNTQTYVAIGYLMLMGSFVGYNSYVWLINNAPPALVSTYAYVNPVVAILLGWLLMGETLSLRTLEASAVVLVGVVLITVGRRK